MNQRKKLQAILFSIIAVIAITTFGYPSYIQNKFMYSYFKNLLNAIQQQDKAKVEQYYKDTKNLLPEYWVQMFKYKMVGWNIKSIGGQPWPLDDELQYKMVEISLYYDFPTKNDLPVNGKMISHPKYGNVLEVSTICRFVPKIHTKQGTEVILMLPGQGGSFDNWLAPYERK